MKKKLLLFLAYCGLALFASVTTATVSFAQEDESLVFWDIVESEPLLVPEAGQITVNSIYYGDGDGIEALLDEDESTWYHSAYGPTGRMTDEEGNIVSVENLYPAEKHWIQFDLVEPQTDVIIRFVCRNSAYNDSPDDITILATDNPSDSKSWVEMAHFTDLLAKYSSTSEMAGQTYMTPRIHLGEGYRYIRMVVNHTFSGRTEGEYGQYFWNMAELQIFPAVIIDDPITRLTIGGEKYYDLGMEMYGIEDEYKGTLPGFFGAAEVDAFIDAFEEYLDGIEGNPTNEEVDQILTKLGAAYDALMASEIKVDTGYYRFISAYEEYLLQQEVEKAMVASDDGKWLRWRTYDDEDLAAIWILKKLEDGNFSIQNAQTKTYIDFIGSTSSHVPMVEEQTTEQIFESVARGIFMIYNTQLKSPYHTESHSGGAGKEGYIVPWGNASQPHSTWYLRPVSQEEFERVRELGDQANIDRDFAIARAAANKALMQAIEYLPYITEVSNENTPDVSQLWSNALEHNEGSLENLIDEKINTHFHSEYSLNDLNSITDDYHCLFADLRTAADKFFWTFTPRQSEFLDIPQDVIIYGSNDISNWENPDTWTEIEHVTKGFPTDAATTYVSPQIQPETPYRYLKFEVLSNFSGRSNGNTGVPYFTMSEFQIYSYNYDEAHSQYVHAEGMKEAVDALTALLNELDRKEVLTRPEVTALQEAVKKVNDLYVDHTELANELAALLPDAELAYHNATDCVHKLITKGSQFSVNSKIREGSFDSILDGDWDTHFSTDWSAGAQNPDGSYGAKHHLQVDLEDSYDDVRLRLVGRNSWYFDMPSDIDVYITNDPELGGNILSPTDEWTFLTNINEGLPEEPWLEWTSDDLHIDGNRYFRMVVNNTWMLSSETNTSRTDDEGMPFFTLAEFQLIQEADISDIQYGYVPDVKKWADRLAELIAENKDKEKYDVWPQDVAGIKEAMEALQNAYVHNDALLAEITKALDLAEHAEVGDDFAYVPSQDVIDALAAACDAATVVAKGHTLQPELDAEVIKLQTAEKAFLSKVKMPELNKWYNIVNVAVPRLQTQTDEDGNTTEVDIQAYCAGKAMAVKSFTVGDSPSYGYYDPETEEATYADAAAAFWRFVPIEGTDCVAIQNMLTSHYIGAVTARGDATGKPLLTAEPAPYKVEYYGAGELIFNSQDSLNLANNCGPLHAQERNGGPIVAWPADHGNASCWTVREPSAEKELTMPAKLNTISILTLPFAIEESTSIAALNPGEAQTYALAAIEADEDGNTCLNLVEKEAFAAGEPFFLVFGDIEDEDAEVEDDFLYINRPADINPQAQADGNGLVGTLTGTTLQEEGLGYIKNNRLLSSGSGRINIPGLSGYIEAGLCHNSDEAPGLVLTCNGALKNGLQIIAIDRHSADNVLFDLTGRPVQRATRGLYILNGKKYLAK